MLAIQVPDGNDTSFLVNYTWINNFYNVHGFPHIKFFTGYEETTLPLNISLLKALNFSSSWSTEVTATGLSDISAIDNARIRANVAIDMFLDSDPTTSQSRFPDYEVMVWLSSTGGIDPVGSASKDSSGDQMRYDIQLSPNPADPPVRFFLSYGQNNRGQKVYSWQSSQMGNTTSVGGQGFQANFAPLLQYLWQFGLVPSDLFLGTVQFGTETFFAGHEATFSANNPNMTIETASSGVSGAGANGTVLSPLHTPTTGPKNEAERWTCDSSLLFMPFVVLGVLAVLV